MMPVVVVVVAVVVAESRPRASVPLGAPKRDDPSSPIVAPLGDVAGGAVEGSDDGSGGGGDGGDGGGGGLAGPPLAAAEGTAVPAADTAAFEDVDVAAGVAAAAATVVRGTLRPPSPETRGVTTPSRP